VLALEEHMQRLKNSALCAGIQIGNAEVIDMITRVIKEGAFREDCPDEGNCLVKSYITGGDINKHGIFPEPRTVVIFESGPIYLPKTFECGVVLQPTAQIRPHPNIKSTNYLSGLMQLAHHEEAIECLYCPEGKVTEAWGSSFFICRDGTIATALLKDVLKGITREKVLALAEENGLAVEERQIDVSELVDADEAFLASSWKEVMPVVKVGNITIANGKPGPISKKLLALYRENVRRWLQ
jgi:branched-chain amino acid aminotransferase